MSKHDIAIIGGGPGGATVGTLLKKYDPSLDVVILEREKFPRDHVGESQLPAISQILDEMEVWDKVEEAEFPIKIGAVYKWGCTDELWDLDFIISGRFEDEARPAKYVGQRTKTAFQVDRSIYDKVLLDHAREWGCEVREETRVTKVLKDGDRIQGLETVFKDGSTETVEARYYVDCSGDVGIVRRAFDIGIESPTALRNIAIWDYWQDASWAVNIGNGGTRIVVMSLGWGWIWFIPITPTRTSVGLVLPASYYKESGKTREEIYAEALRTEPYVAKLLENAHRENRTEATKDWNFLADRLCGENWFMVGDTCGFADPILSAGMTLAHVSARKAAYTILELDRDILDPDWLKREYSEGHRAQIRHHMQFADYWYTANGRFTELKEYCSEIARTAGLDLKAEDAFRWLSTGGFALEEPGLARALSYGVTGLKRVAQLLGKETIDWELAKTNHWKLNLEGATEDLSANYRDGDIHPIRTFTRGKKLLPVLGMYALVVQALERHSDAVTILELCVNDTIRDGCEPAEAVRIVLETVESMIVEGWITTKLVPGRPCIKVSDIGAEVR